jgi:nicotinate-nucleotide adenylyltransferase
MTERIALYGGTFDPFHCGHLDPLRSVRDRMGWSRVIYIPAYVQPFKTDLRTSSPFHRFAMAVLGTEAEPWMYVSTWELERGEISYTVETLRHFAAADPRRTYDWIIGDDNLESLTRWRALDEILSVANFVVLQRGGTRAVDPSLAARVRTPEERGRAGSIVFADNEPVKVSATEVRDRIRRGEDAGGLLPPRVERYIRAHRLYEAQEVSD